MKVNVTTVKAKRRSVIAAQLMDTVIFLVLLALISIPATISLINVRNNPTGGTSVGLFVLSGLTGALAAIVGILYTMLVPYLWNGQTLGMRILKIRYVNEFGEDVKTRQIIVRAIVECLIAVLTMGVYIIVDILCVVLSVDGRRFADVISRVKAVDTKNKPGRAIDKALGA